MAQCNRQDSFHAEIIDQVADNVAVVKDVSSEGTGNPVDMEQIALWDPDVIIFARKALTAALPMIKSGRISAIKWQIPRSTLRSL